MNFWIINPYGNIPTDNWRVHRSFMLSEALVKNGDKVTYWISDIDHRSKQRRNTKEQEISGISLKIISSSHYKNHISIDRILFEINFIREMLRTAEKEKHLPDLIIIGEPALFISWNFSKFVKRHKIPFIIDMVDIWPELFKVALPSILKRYDKFIFLPFYLKRRWFIRKATAITAVAQSYLDIAKKYNRTIYNKCLYIGVDLVPFRSTSPNNLGFNKKNNEFWIIYAGTLGNNYDILSIIELGKYIQENQKKYQLFIAGDGNMKEDVIQAIKKFKLSNTHYIGRLDPEQLVGFYKNCDFALSTYSKFSTVALPVKFFDYIASGLPIINSLGRDLGKMVTQHKIGLNYESGNYHDLIQKVEQLTEDHNQLIDMKTNAKKLSEQFEKNNIYSKYVEFCHSVINKRK